jgi:formylmethanofuran dehydrogenase subunit A
MSVQLVKIAGGMVYDPANGVDGEVRDLWIDGSKIVAAPADPTVRPTRTIDATGLVVMPGGVDMHCHIAGPKANAARLLCPENKGDVVRRSQISRSGTAGCVPSTFATGHLYAGLGYTTACEAAVPPLLARHAHMELADTPCLDKACFVLVGNNHYVMRTIGRREPERLRTFLAWLLGAARAYAPKLVNPGGVEAWKQGASATGIDDVVPGFGVTPREIIVEVTRAANDLALPHPVHIHANNLGMPGNWATTLETMRALDGLHGHLTHVQFHSYGGADQDSFRSQTAPLAEYVNSHPSLTVDVGQVLFGKTIGLTGDSPLGYFLQKVYRGKWLSSDIEQEAGCGVTPIRYRNKSLVHALQWAIGLEWFLLVDDPWRVAMSTDHPNGGSFLAYPQIVRLLMDRAYRQEVLGTCPPEVQERSLLGELDREYTLGEITIITRAGPAHILGLTGKGHLGPGADADITIYTPHENRQTMFELPRLIIKGGEVVVQDGEIRAAPAGITHHVAPEYDRNLAADIERWFNEDYSIRLRNYAVSEDAAN